MYVYVYIHVYIHIYVYIFIYTLGRWGNVPQSGQGSRLHPPHSWPSIASANPLWRRRLALNVCCWWRKRRWSRPNGFRAGPATTPGHFVR